MTMRPGYGIPAWGDAGGAGYMRASNADRERAIDVLKAGFAEGRLDKDEYDDRVSAAYAARTYADLAVVTGDLPDLVSAVLSEARHVAREEAGHDAGREQGPGSARGCDRAEGDRADGEPAEGDGGEPNG